MSDGDGRMSDGDRDGRNVAGDGVVPDGDGGLSDGEHDGLKGIPSHWMGKPGPAKPYGEEGNRKKSETPRRASFSVFVCVWMHI